MEVDVNKISLMIQEELSLSKEIDTLNKDNQRKARVILGLYNVIVKTGDINLIAEAGIAMKEAQEE